MEGHRVEEDATSVESWVGIGSNPTLPGSGSIAVLATSSVTQLETHIAMPITKADITLFLTIGIFFYVPAIGLSVAFCISRSQFHGLMTDLHRQRFVWMWG
jgi:hypothetical protein